MAQRGYGHRKLHPYIPKSILAIAPGLGRLLDNNREEITDQGNKILSGPGEMTQSQATGQLKRDWGRAKRKGSSARKISQYIEDRGGSRGRAKKILKEAHNVIKFGDDPDNK